MGQSDKMDSGFKALKRVLSFAQNLPDSDVRIICEDGRKFPAHKLILAMNHPFLKGNTKTRFNHPFLFFIIKLSFIWPSRIQDFVKFGHLAI